jgi:hypothetical protein
MRVIERSEYRDEEGKISFMNRIDGMLEFGLGWYPKMQAQEVATERLAKVLGDEHYLLRNAPIPGADKNEPTMILVSPQGIRLILTYPIRGVYRAKGDDWMTFNQRARRFRPKRPNLQQRALKIAGRLRMLLEAQEIDQVDVEAVLIFTNPRTLVDSANPYARIVSADAIEYFAANLEQMPAKYSSVEVRRLVDAILHPKFPEPEPLPETALQEPAFSEEEAQAQEDTYTPAFLEEDLLAFERATEYEDLMAEEPQAEAEFQPEFMDVAPFADEEAFPQEEQQPPPRPAGGFSLRVLSARQWILLGLLLFLELLVIAAFAYVVLRGGVPIP